MAETFNFDFYQIPHTGVEEPDLDAATRTDSKVPIRRQVDMKMSYFGSNKVGARLGDDYTRVTSAFKDKDELADWSRIKPEWQYAERNENPLLAGSTIKYVRDDQFIRMTMSKDNGAYIGKPAFDVMDSNEVTADGIAASSNAAIKNWPSEGWRSFGGKYDFLPYDGGILK